jgi:putative hemolysin
MKATMSDAAVQAPDRAAGPVPLLTPIAQRSGAPRVAEAQPAYALRLADTAAEVRAAQFLRYGVFNLELGEGLEESHLSCLDADPFDAACDHLLVEHIATQEIVGTYRLQSGRRAASVLGYYSAREFDLRPFEPVRDEVIELGRACVARAHRNLAVLGLLWKGIARYAQRHQARYLIGCSSLTSQDPRAGARVYSDLMRHHLVEERFLTTPQPGYACPLAELASSAVPTPKLLAAYLALGARICGAPAIDRDFKTVDFLTFCDLSTLAPRAVERYLA